jgi:hypothetical protein
MLPFVPHGHPKGIDSVVFTIGSHPGPVERLESYFC